jgi:hypothetical protein
MDSPIAIKPKRGTLIVGVITLLFLPFLLLVACDSQLQENPPSSFAPSNVYTNASGVDAAVKGIYDAVRGGSYYGNAHISLVENHTDYSIGRGSQNPMSLFDLDAVNRSRINNSVWGPAYEAINRANEVIANVQGKEDIEGLTEAKRNQFLGEARWLRALNYFNLVRLFSSPDGAGVPLRLQPASGSEENLNTSRASADEVYSQIISDLQFAEQNLPGSYEGSDRGRVTSWAAKALLSKVHLTRENWSNAEGLADEIINSGQFELLVPDDTSAEFERIFGVNAQAGVTNNEVIWEISFARPDPSNGALGWIHSGRAGYYSGGVFAWFGNIDICRVAEAFDQPLNRPEDCGPPSGIEKESFLGAWHEQRDVDRRANHTLYDPTRAADQNILSPEFPMFFRKYRSPGQSDATNPFPVVRYAETIYIKSEAEFRQNGATSEAREYLNMMRRRARGLDPATPNSAADVSSSLSGRAFLDTLLIERAKEFVLEQKRYYDLKRTEKNGELRAFWIAKELGKGTPEMKNFFWPLPQQEIANNDSLSQADQNPGW